MNNAIAQIFDEIADMLEILGENVFRIRAYRRGAEVVRSVAEDLSETHRVNDGEIEKLPGIGKDLHAKIVEFIETGKCKMHEELVEKLSPEMLEILRIRGIGPKKVKLFYEQLGIMNLDQLRAAAESGALATLPRMGEKSQAAILEALNRGSIGKERIDYGVARKVADSYIDYMKGCDGLMQIEAAGSLRRKKATIGDVDLLVSVKGDFSDDEAGKEAFKAVAAKLSEHFIAYGKVVQKLSHGATKSSVLLDGNIQVDFRVVAHESFGATLLYFTGSKFFNIHMRTIALKKGLKINEYGVYRGEERLAGETELGCFEVLEMDYVEPHNREEV
jgi:DNA polymerase (family 10)